MNTFPWHRFDSITGGSRPRGLALVVALSAALHGLMLGLPLPSENRADLTDPATPEQAQGPALDVAILPRGVLSPPSNQTPPTPAPEATPAASVPQAPKPNPHVEPQAEPRPPTAVDRDRPPPPPPETPTDSVTSLPEEPGTSSSDTSITVPDPPPDNSLEARLRNAEAYRYSSGEVLLEEDGQVGPKAWQKLSDWAAPDQGIAEALPTDLIIPYHLGSVCLNPAPIPGMLALVINPDDTFLKEPEVISSTGYPVLDEKAEEMVKTFEYSLPPRTESRGYVLKLQVQYPDSCPD